jgi:hypothetical protein
VVEYLLSLIISGQGIYILGFLEVDGSFAEESEGSSLKAFSPVVQLFT